MDGQKAEEKDDNASRVSLYSSSADLISTVKPEKERKISSIIQGYNRTTPNWIGYPF